MIKPNFYIVGAPKCGTSAMWKFLKQHPDIYMPEQKEIYNFFDSDLKYHFPVLTEKEYLKYFDSYNSETLIGEANVFNLSSEIAPKNIFKFSPNAKIIIMLRHPVEMAYALYTEQVFNGNEPLSFKDALSVEKERLIGKSIPKGISFSEKSLCYVYMASFYKQVKRYIDVFGNDNVHIIFFEDLNNDIAAVYKNTLKFLGASTNFEPQFIKVNPNQEVRSKWFRDYLRHLPNSIRVLSKIIFPHKAFRKKLFHTIRNSNSKITNRKPLTREVEQYLYKEFEDDIDYLQELLGRELKELKSN